MRAELVNAMGKKAFIQSLRPYRATLAKGVRIFGLDTEYVPRMGEASELLTWQLAGLKGDSEKVVVHQKKKLSLASLYAESQKMCGEDEGSKTLVYVTFFSLAEIQFFDLKEWVISEFKGKYKLKQHFNGKVMSIVDLADWFPNMKLEAVAKLWGEKKVEYPIGEKVEAIVAGTLTRGELLRDEEFLAYAKHDAVVTQRIFTKMRNYFLKEHEVDIVNTLTPANTSASIFRATLQETIGQQDTKLRSLALRCCWGGRMEAIFRGTKKMVYEYDATGHHPNSAIALGVLPLENSWFVSRNLREWFSGVSGIGWVWFRFHPDEKFPCLPVYNEEANSLMFPLQGFSYCTVTEARQASSQGAMVKLLKGYHYKTGTDALTLYLQSLQEIRNKSKDPAERDLLKRMSNGVIGKLFQKKIGVDLAQVQKYADDHDIPYSEAIKLENMSWNTGEIKVGSCFYPEWYSLILGFARASIGYVARKHDALIISSDSFVTEDDNLGDGFTEWGITFTKKSEGELVSYRTRFYRVGDKLAHHAVHNKVAAAEVLEKFLGKPTPFSAMGESTFRYKNSRILHLKESWVNKQPFGCRIERDMSTGLGFDYKRQLLEGGETRPWNETEDRQKWLEQERVEAISEKVEKQETEDENG
jgi:hypothetical protein